jgi:type I restriction enzyme S subunit
MNVECFAESIPAGYKQTEVGVIPEDWEVASIDSFTSFASGNGISISKLNKHSDDNPIPVYGGNGIAGYTNCSLVENPTVIIGRVGQKCGEVYLSEGPAWITDNALYPRKIFRALDVRFLALALKAVNLNDLKNRNDLPLVTQSILNSVHISIPPTLGEQEAIAQALTDADALIESLEQLIAKKRQIKQGAMQELLAGKRRLPGFSGEWEVKKLSDVAVLSKTGINPSSSAEILFTHYSLPAFDEGASPIIENGSLIGSNKFRVPPNSILVSKLNPRIPRIWAPSDIPANAICSTEFLVLVPHENNDRNFLAYLCSSSSFCYQMELQATGTTGSHQRIPPSMAIAIEVNVPYNKAEQAAIANTLSDIDAEINALEKKLYKAKLIKQGMMQELLTGRIRLV